MRVFLNTKLLHVERHGDKKRVCFEHGGEEKSAEAGEIIYAMGRAPRIGGLNLENAGVTTEGGIQCHPNQQTNVPHIFVAGDAGCRHEIVHIAIRQGEVAAHNATKLVRKSKEPLEETDYRIKMSVVFSEPEIASVGPSEKELQHGNIPYKSAKYPFDDHGKSMVIGETEGFVKLLVSEKSREILGASVVGPHGSDLMPEIAVAMHFHATAGDLSRVPHYHPTLSEIWTYPAEELAGG